MEPVTTHHLVYDSKVETSLSPIREIDEIIATLAKILKNPNFGLGDLDEFCKTQGNRFVLEDLKQRRFSVLYDHLIKMSTCLNHIKVQSVNEKMSLDLMALLILQTRERIIEEVKNMVGNSGDRAVIFILGATGSGKSTTLCFLTDEPMFKNILGFYESRNPGNQYIGHALNKSCTFLPNISTSEHFVFIDFPGFQDTFGPVICLGMELALKALVKEYETKSKILLLHPINDTEGRMLGIKRLVTRMARILVDKNGCQVGLTKYSKLASYILLKDEKRKQRTKMFNEAETEEVVLKTRKELLLEFNLKEIVEKEGINDQLAKIQIRKEEIPIQKLPDTEEKKKHRLDIKIIELEIAIQFGWFEKLDQFTREEAALLDQKFIRFKELEGDQSAALRDVCMTRLSQAQPVEINPRREIDVEDISILNNAFRRFIVHIIDIKFPPFDWADSVEMATKKIENFRKSVREIGLVQTVTKDKYPQIGQFLNLPENDPNIGINFDRIFLQELTDKNMKEIVKKINVRFIEGAKSTLSLNLNPDEKEILESNVGHLRESIISLIDPIIDENTPESKKEEERWKEVERKYSSDSHDGDAVYAKQNWDQIDLFFPEEIPILTDVEDIRKTPPYLIKNEKLRSFLKQQHHAQLVVDTLKQL